MLIYSRLSLLILSGVLVLTLNISSLYASPRTAAEAEASVRQLIVNQPMDDATLAHLPAHELANEVIACGMQDLVPGCLDSHFERGQASVAVISRGDRIAFLAQFTHRPSGQIFTSFVYFYKDEHKPALTEIRFYPMTQETNFQDILTGRSQMVFRMPLSLGDALSFLVSHIAAATDLRQLYHPLAKLMSTERSSNIHQELLQALAAKRDVIVAGTAVYQLAVLRILAAFTAHHDLMQQIVEPLMAAGDPAVRLSAATVMAQSGLATEPVRAILREGLSNRNRSLRLIAAQMLRRLPAPTFR